MEEASDKPAQEPPGVQAEPKKKRRASSKGALLLHPNILSAQEPKLHCKHNMSFDAPVTYLSVMALSRVDLYSFCPQCWMYFVH